MINVRFRLIHQGRVLEQMYKTYDGPYEAHAKEIEDDVLDGMDPLALARKGEQAAWVEARV